MAGAGTLETETGGNALDREDYHLPNPRLHLVSIYHGFRKCATHQGLEKYLGRKKF